MQGLLTGAVNQLPLLEREVLTLYDYDELTMKEVAKALGIGASRVSQIHSSAMLHLRTRLFKTFAPRPHCYERRDDSRERGAKKSAQVALAMRQNRRSFDSKINWRMRFPVEVIYC